MSFRVLVAFFAGVTSAITTILIPVAYFGDKNSRWAKRLAIIAFICRRDFDGGDLLGRLTLVSQDSECNGACFRQLSHAL
jgi:hypothetical protein